MFMNVLQKEKTNINIFKLILQRKKRSTLQSDASKNSISNNNKNNNGLSKNDLKLPIPSLKDMEFSWSENY